MIAIILFYLFSIINGLSIDIKSKDSVCKAAGSIVEGELNYYEGIKNGGTVGKFQAPYYWWHAGEAFTGLIDYYTYCDSSNTTLQKIIQNAIIHQAGSNYDFMPSNESSVEANDDQGMWGLTLMQAIERNFPEADSNHKYLDLLKTVFDKINNRWDSGSCKGGIRWQISKDRSGYDYKNTIANGILFNLASRLAKYTKEDSYSKTASKIWDWMKDVGFINVNDNSISIYDGGHVDENCSDFDKTNWSYIYGVILSGNAYMYNHTDNDSWLTNTQHIINGSKNFFKNNIMYEPSCMDNDSCNNDQRAFRSLFARNLKLTGLVASDVDDDLTKWLESSAKAAAQSCSGGTDGITCGQDWNHDGWDSKYGLGEQMSALNAVMTMVVNYPSNK
ncbi:cell wall mannosidase [Hyphopichia burtonii NRRL Y-1933]|uniref:mannan endo-1,6-alpha-mannosidase n=1 Tax=Hyphopichia burtonii NRRL Y-1933 TaxID=984485 RepID=A0A1E4RBJ5_9ASCO|nr:cell wall mannosidase [Hyphopichia burtonii NRRL Y-1933]ODV64593.1 cell wall mannosidase [Hyphopichia burtonii NRRL Y-1933]